ncbi:MAG: hypothetical protein Q8O56_02625 [Solirubrobacteraceae bacterium]|nr:hypothetical protein [Solirubrobacteraceae bacterium]
MHDSITNRRPRAITARAPRTACPLDRRDAERLALALQRAGAAAGADVTDLLPTVGPFARAALRRSCAYAHHGLLLFPASLDAAIGDFAARRLEPVAPVPSVLVRGRLCARFALEHDACDVSVTRLHSGPRAAGHDLEVFAFPQTAPALRPEIVDAERLLGYEDHLAVHVAQPDTPTLDRLMTILQADAGLVFEGGGHNPHEGAAGATVLYFVGETARSAYGRRARFERFELYCEGDLSAVVDRHPVDREAVARAYARWADIASPASARGT